MRLRAVRKEDNIKSHQYQNKLNTNKVCGGHTSNTNQCCNSCNKYPSLVDAVLHYMKEPAK